MKTINTVIRLFFALTLLTGVVYPFLIFGIAQVAFNNKANGSIIELNGTKTGSLLIGQQFVNNRYFWPRPSAVEYHSECSSGSNLALTNAKLKTLVEQRKQQFKQSNGLDSLAIVPAEMQFASASGLDPHISPLSAQLQKQRIIQARKLTKYQIEVFNRILMEEIEKPQYGIFGEPRVNVLHLNIRLDNAFN
jgi:potassium-transporting ATPase KdpC subunit